MRVGIHDVAGRAFLSDGHPFGSRMTRARAAAAWGSVAAVALGALLRLCVSGDVDFSPADESRYLAMASSVAEGGLSAFHGLVTETLARPELQQFPTPLLYGYVLAAACACKLHGVASFEALASLSRAAGIVTVVLTAWVGWRVAGARVAAFAAFVVACSPLALALGRRALQDSVVVAATTLVLALALELRRDVRMAPSRAWSLSVGVSLASAFLVALKETSLFLLLALVVDAAVAAFRDRTVAWRVAPLVAGPLLAAVGFLAWAGNFAELRALVEVAERSADGAYVRAFMAGPPHRVLVDLLVLAPVATLLAVLGLFAQPAAKSDSSSTRLVATFLLTGLVAASCLPKNVRFTAALEPALALFAALGLSSVAGARVAVTALTLGGLGLSSWLIFARVFLERRVYDPTTFDVLAALDAVPHSGPMSAGTFGAPAVAIVVTAVAIALTLGARETNRVRGP